VEPKFRRPSTPTNALIILQRCALLLLLRVGCYDTSCQDAIVVSQPNWYHRVVALDCL
jgi:hypothetical protein